MSDDLRSRIEALNKGPLKNVPAQPAPAPEVKVSTKQTLEAPRRPGVPCLEETIAGVVMQPPVGPDYYYVQQPAVELENAADLICRNVVQLTGYPDGEAVERIARCCQTKCIAPEHIMFLDLETTGLSRTPVFLIGTMECSVDGLVFKQYFARNYSEEVSILSAFSERLKCMRMLVTFNGASFDVPFLQSRALVHGVKLPEICSHLDLLHEARRIYKGQTPNCKLQTLEYCICGRAREDDIPGAAIPQVYHNFVRTGDAGTIGQVLVHNLYDLLTMADLMRHMWRTL